MIKKIDINSLDFYKFKKYSLLSTKDFNNKEINQKLKFYYNRLKNNNNLQLGGNLGEFKNDLVNFIFEKILIKLNIKDLNYLNDLIIISRQNELFNSLKEKFKNCDNFIIKDILKNESKKKFTLNDNDKNFDEKIIICAFMVALASDDIIFDENFVNSKEYVYIIYANKETIEDDKKEFNQINVLDENSPEKVNQILVLEDGAQKEINQYVVLEDGLPNEINQKVENVSPKEEDVSPKEEDESPKEENVSPKEENESPKEENVSPKEENVSPKEENKEGSPKEENVSPKEEVEIETDSPINNFNENDQENDNNDTIENDTIENDTIENNFQDKLLEQIADQKTVETQDSTKSTPSIGGVKNKKKKKIKF